MPNIKHWHLAGLSGYRGQSVEQLHARLLPTLAEKVGSQHQNIALAIDHCLSCVQDNDTVLVIGSFLTVAAAEQALQARGQ